MIPCECVDGLDGLCGAPASQFWRFSPAGGGVAFCARHSDGLDGDLTEYEYVCAEVLAS